MSAPSPDLAALIGEARTAATGEAARIMTICNACRYCEGFCAVFPAMTRRLVFGEADLDYLAHLCHQCGACYYSCQYAPPHEFAVDVPRTLAQVRTESQKAYTVPRSLGRLLDAPGATFVSSTLASLLILALAARSWRPGPGDFYAVFPHNGLAAGFGLALVFGMALLAVLTRRFWRSVHPRGAASGGAARADATRAALSLRYLGGGHGEGCNEGDDRFSLARRHAHHAVFYGFLLCFAATLVATFDHYALGLPAPYPLTSAPVVLGTAGGILLVVGCIALAALARRRGPERSEVGSRRLNQALLLFLGLTAASGLVLLAARNTGAMAVLLVIHLAFVLAFFLTLPYGKFAHASLRSAALLHWAWERRRPHPVALGDE